MGTSQLGRGHKPYTGTEAQSTEWQTGRLPEKTENNNSARVQKHIGQELICMSRESWRGLMWAGRHGPRRRPGQRLNLQQGTLPGQPPRQKKCASANDPASCN
jgi:hypothetical protein